MRPILHIQLLGVFRLQYGNEVVDSDMSPLTRSLLAYLLVHRHTPQSRQQVAFLFWPDSRESQARTNLRRELHALRQRLPNADEFLAIDAQTLQWHTDAPYELDIADFEQRVMEAEKAETPAAARVVLAEAAALYRGPLFPACYAEWILYERERLELKYLHVLAQLIEIAEAERAYPQAIAYAQDLLHNDPLNEATYRCLMRLHSLNQNRAGAVHTYHICAEILERELGVPPDTATEELYLRLVRQEGRITPVAKSERARRILVGRQAEWARLQRFWQLAQDQGARFVVISGEAGIGKSQLAEELRWTVHRQGHMTSWARGYAAEGGLAYTPVSTWLRSEALAPAVDRLDDIWRIEVARLLPELLAGRPHLPHPQPITDSWQRQRFFESLALSVRLVEDPLLLVLDDLQWCDQETLEWIHFLLRANAQMPMLVVGTVRLEEVATDHPLPVLLRALRASGQMAEIAVGPLAQEETAVLASHVAGQDLDTEFTAQLHQEAEGNPLFVLELIQTRALTQNTSSKSTEEFTPQAARAGSTTLPPKLYHVIEARLSQLSAPARELAQVAATVGRAFTFHVLSSASEQNEDTLVACLDELWQRRIIREQGADAYDFSHDKIREVAYGEISTARRRLLHKRVALAIETIYASNLDEVSGQLATHFDRANMAEQAIHYYRQAARVAWRAYVNEDAVFYLSAARRLIQELPDTPERNELEISVLVELGSALQSAGSYRSQQAKEVFEQAYERCENDGETRHLLPTVFGLRTYYFSIGDHNTAAELSERLLQMTQQDDDLVQRMRAHHGLWTSLFTLGQFTRARAQVEAGTSLYEEVRHFPDLMLYDVHDPGICCLSFAGPIFWVLGYPGQAMVHIDQGLALARQFTHPPSVVQPYYYASIVHLLRGQPQAVQTHAEAAYRYGTETRVIHWLGWAECLLGWAQTQLGQPAAGLKLYREGLAFFEEAGLMYTFFRTLLAEIYLQQGQIDEGLEALSLAMAAAQRTGERWWEAEMYRLRGDALLVQGDFDAERAYQQAIDIAQRQEARSLELRAVMGLCRLCLRLGNHAKARCILEDVYGWFTEGHDTADLQKAQTLLAELSTPSSQ